MIEMRIPWYEYNLLFLEKLVLDIFWTCRDEEWFTFLENKENLVHRNFKV